MYLRSTPVDSHDEDSLGSKPWARKFCQETPPVSFGPAIGRAVLGTCDKVPRGHAEGCGQLEGSEEPSLGLINSIRQIGIEFLFTGKVPC